MCDKKIKVSLFLRKKLILFKLKKKKKKKKLIQKTKCMKNFYETTFFSHFDCNLTSHKDSI